MNDRPGEGRSGVGVGGPSPEMGRGKRGEREPGGRQGLLPQRF